MKALGEILKELREEKKISQRGLSEKTGLTQTHISKIESNLVEPTIATIFKICKSLEIDAAVVSNLMAKSFKSYLQINYGEEYSKRKISITT